MLSPKQSLYFVLVTSLTGSIIRGHELKWCEQNLSYTCGYLCIKNVCWIFFLLQVYSQVRIWGSICILCGPHDLPLQFLPDRKSHILELLLDNEIGRNVNSVYTYFEEEQLLVNDIFPSLKCLFSRDTQILSNPLEPLKRASAQFICQTHCSRFTAKYDHKKPHLVHG